VSVTLKARQVGDITVIDAVGRITLGDGANSLGASIAQIAAKQNQKVLLNMRGVAYMDSSGVGELVYSFTTVTNHGGNLKLVAVPDKVRNLLKMTNLHTLFEVFDDEAAAVRSFS
jgi:anti-sigma B factor antagonist